MPNGQPISLLERACVHCGEMFEPEPRKRANDPGFCPACWQVSVWEEDAEPTETVQVIQLPVSAPSRWNRNIEIGLAVLGACAFSAILRCC